ncbi:MAG: NAD(P)/FAD-dependent oxidoreductase [Phycisphaerales bacterium]|nr:NAD(P)/FAD-dependent oxidoreductase [Phycisphaerales bacterium]
MHFDAVIIGAGMSGLAAGIRLAYFDKRVCIVEKHYAFGGLNSYYTLGGRKFDVGLHAVTNYAGPERRSAPLSKLLRQLRLTRDDFDLHEQRFSEVQFPGRRLRFTNDIGMLIDEVAREFPSEADRFRRLVERIRDYDDLRLDAEYRPTRPILRDALGDSLLIEMLLCPIMLYGSAEEHDMDFTQFITLFKSIFLEGFARPPGGVRTIIKALVRKFRASGGRLMMRSPVARLETDGRRVVGVTLESGETLTADVVLSSAGYEETMRLCSHNDTPPQSREWGVHEPGRISFVESISVLDQPPAKLGHEATIVFYNDHETFTYARPVEPVDLRSGIVCCPNNYEGHDDLTEGVFRLTWLANYEPWMQWDGEAYRAAKKRYHDVFLSQGERFIPGFRDHVVFTDMFTPRTIHYYTGHANGAVYGSPRKRRDGRTPFENLYICGTDQGYLGIIGAMLSGITIANLHVLARE